jgi:hypothetical protein
MNRLKFKNPDFETVNGMGPSDPIFISHAFLRLHEHLNIVM